ncbi:hypothetical protein [Streptomyces sp. NRRL F-5630]|uniref:hypothetical protein n=1 Tax=Streptomyces sp. NRRL F-5630 TaxID=1463864 RepID=UPI003EBFFC78
MNLPDTAAGSGRFTGGATAGAAVPGGGANRDISASPVVPLPNAPATAVSQARTL